MPVAGKLLLSPFDFTIIVPPICTSTIYSRRQLICGPDQSALWQQFLAYLFHALQGDLGNSMRDGRPALLRRAQRSSSGAHVPFAHLFSVPLTPLRRQSLFSITRTSRAARRARCDRRLMNEIDLGIGGLQATRER